MAAKRCDDCDIDFPATTLRCQLCAGTLTYDGNRAPDWDWRDRVERAQRGGDTEFENIVGWRCHLLLEAGADVKTADQLAEKFAVDLHEAVDLVKAVLDSGRPARLAAEILL